MPRRQHGISGTRLRQRAASGPSPSKQLLRGDPVTPRDLGHHRSHRQCLLENPSFLVGRPPTTTPRPREYLDPTRDARLRLKLMVKHIHVPIPNQRSESASSHVVEEGAVRTALTTYRQGGGCCIRALRTGARHRSRSRLGSRPEGLGPSGPGAQRRSRRRIRARARLGPIERGSRLRPVVGPTNAVGNSTRALNISTRRFW